MPGRERSLPRAALLLALGVCVSLAGVWLAPDWGSDAGNALLAAEDDESAAEASRPEPLVNRGKTRDGRTIAQAPPFKAAKRSGDLDMFPCSDCHEGEPVNPKVRQLKEEHTDIQLVHGSGRFWCLTCHNIAGDSDTFISMKGEPISFDAAYLICGQCHFQRQLDWYFGGHGKRAGAFPVQREIPARYDELKVEEREKIGTWQGERRLLSCPACHDPHTPAIRPYDPSPPPPVRKGLALRPLPQPPRERVWERMRGTKE